MAHEDHSERHVNCVECCSELATENAHLEAALELRDVIGQAKGILMATSMLNADEAFALLATSSQRENRHVREIAADIVAGHNS